MNNNIFTSNSLYKIENGIKIISTALQNGGVMVQPGQYLKPTLAPPPSIYIEPQSRSKTAKEQLDKFTKIIEKLLSFAFTFRRIPGVKGTIDGLFDSIGALVKNISKAIVSHINDEAGRQVVPEKLVNAILDIINVIIKDLDVIVRGRSLREKRRKKFVLKKEELEILTEADEIYKKLTEQIKYITNNIGLFIPTFKKVQPALTQVIPRPRQISSNTLYRQQGGEDMSECSFSMDFSDLSELTEEPAMEGGDYTLSEFSLEDILGLRNKKQQKWNYNTDTENYTLSEFSLADILGLSNKKQQGGYNNVLNLSHLLQSGGEDNDNTIKSLEEILSEIDAAMKDEKKE